MLTADNTAVGAEAAEPVETRRPRILHVVTSLDRGGIEMRLLQLLRHRPALHVGRAAVAWPL
jgi:hypothetical protein